MIIGCGTVAQPNLITCSWFGTVSSEPPMVSVSIRKSRFSHHLITETGEFTVNVPRGNELDAVKLCGVKSGRDCRKFSELGLTAVPCPPLESAPMIAEFFHVLACRVREIMELGSHDMFIADVVSLHCREEDRRRIRPDPHGDEQIVYLDGKYWRLTGPIG
jgi:flavin reductase (DIM6/NTAB) family NADH-FMN oxidoreductase RutF